MKINVFALILFLIFVVAGCNFAKIKEMIPGIGEQIPQKIEQATSVPVQQTSPTSPEEQKQALKIIIESLKRDAQLSATEKDRAARYLQAIKDFLEKAENLGFQAGTLKKGAIE